MARKRKKEGTTDQAGHDEGAFSSYAKFSTTLRTWLVAYGVGAPVLFLSHQEVANRLLVGKTGKDIATAFLIGAAIQVVAALLYKTCMWYLYVGEDDEEFKKTRRFRWCNTISWQYWLEFGFDLASVAAFGWATVQALYSLTA